MRRGGRILIVLGLLLGAITAVGTFVVLTQNSSSGPQIAMKKVVVALQNIPERTEIPAEAVGLVDWPESAVPVNAAEDVKTVAGKLAKQPIYQGQIMLQPMFIDKDNTKETRSNASYAIPEGKVAMAFQVSELATIGGAIQTGDTVDLIVTLNPGSMPAPTNRTGTTTTTTGTEGLPSTQVTLQDVLILQVGAWSTGTDKNAQATSIFTFALDRQDALTLKSAREQGQVDVVLRRAGDHKTATTEPVNLQYLNKRFNFNLVPSNR